MLFRIYVKAYIIAVMITPDSFFGIFSDLTRLRALMLIQSEGEACVCELTFALQESQPKISRHLALMRDMGIVEPRREGTWMHYRISPSLPEWSREIIRQIHARLTTLSPYREDIKQLTQMSNRPERSCV